MDWWFDPAGICAGAVRLGKGASVDGAALENGQPAQPVEQIKQTAVVGGDVVALDALRAFRNVGQEMADLARPARLGDVEDDEAAVPIAGIEPVALAQWMMAAVRRALPTRLLAAAGPLSGHPPAADLARVRRVAEVEDHHDVAAIARDRG